MLAESSGNAAALPPEILTLFFSFGCYFPEERRRYERSTLPLFSRFSGDLELLESQGTSGGRGGRPPDGVHAAGNHRDSGQL